jgi:phage shock protein A
MRWGIDKLAHGALLLAVMLAVAAPSGALPVPSKTARDQSLAERDADLARIGHVLGQEGIFEALAAQGLTEGQIHQRLAQLTPEELQALSSQLDQLHAAGAQVPQYVWILVAVLLGVLILGALF